MNKILAVLLFSVLMTGCSSNSKNDAYELLVAGPMIGYVEHNEAMLWLGVSPKARRISVEAKEGNTNASMKFSKVVYGKNNLIPVKIRLTGLGMNKRYDLKININGRPVEGFTNLGFTTKDIWEWRKPAPDFSFNFGSCVFINDSAYDRPGKPYGQSTQILNTMASKPADFNLWGGDNVYFRESDVTSESGIQYRYEQTRSQSCFNSVFRARPNYAIWDDHDFGPDNSNRSFRLKETTRDFFNKYWGNPGSGENEKGIYYKFSWSDAEFFMLDNRYFRDPNELVDSNKTYLGESQLDWLMSSLVDSRASIKFIAAGNQFLNPYSKEECYSIYSKELQGLLKFIEVNQIEGIVFLSGDRHYTDLSKYQFNNLYPLYELTSSPLTSSPYSVKNEEFSYDSRVDGTLTIAQNFCNVMLEGEGKNRKITIKNYDINGQQLWSKSIGISELRFKTPDEEL